MKRIILQKFNGKKKNATNSRYFVTNPKDQEDQDKKTKTDFANRRILKRINLKL